MKKIGGFYDTVTQRSDKFKFSLNEYRWVQMGNLSQSLGGGCVFFFFCF